MLPGGRALQPQGMQAIRPLHKLLERQARRHFGSLDRVPEGLRPFLESVSIAYEQADRDRGLVEHSLELASQELLQRNAELRAKHQEQQVIFDSVPALIIYKDTENRILRLNEVAAKALGGTAAQIEGRRTSELLPKEVADRLYEDDLEVIRSGQPRLGIIESHPTADGQVHWMRTDKVPFLDDAGKVTGVVVFSVDITERKNAEVRLRESEAKLSRAYEQLQHVDRERTQFLNNAAHELATPLTPIKLQMRLLRLENQSSRTLEILDRNFDRLGHLVKDLLDAARLQAASLRLHRRETDLREIVAQSVETYQPAAREAGVDLRVVAPMPEVVACIDPGRIGQVLDNMLSNAIKFTPAGGRIAVALEGPAGKAVIRVTDTGAGIRPTDLDRLFRPFSQVHDTMQRTLGGTGLGLYVSRGIIEAHGGTIQAASKGLGQGATFAFEVPVEAPEPPEPSAPDGVPAAHAGGASGEHEGAEASA